MVKIAQLCEGLLFAGQRAATTEGMIEEGRHLLAPNIVVKLPIRAESLLPPSACF